MNRKLSLIFGTLISLIILGLSLFSIFGPKKEYLKTTGIITNFRLEHSATDDITYKTIINYSVDGIEYKDVEYGSYNSSMKIGDEVTVLYNPINPTQIQAEGFEKVAYVTLPISIIGIMLCIIGFIKQN